LFLIVSGRPDGRRRAGEKLSRPPRTAYAIAQTPTDTFFSQSQWFSWIHREDAVGIILESLVNPGIEGPVNVTSPNPVRMAEMCSALGRTLGRPNWLPVPDFAIQALLGEGATVVLQGQKVEPSAALKAGYEFKFEKLEDALGDILR